MEPRNTKNKPPQWVLESIFAEDSDQPEDEVAEEQLEIDSYLAEEELDTDSDIGEEKPDTDSDLADDDDYVYEQGSDGEAERNTPERAELESQSQEVEVLAMEVDQEAISEEEVETQNTYDFLHYPMAVLDTDGSLRDLPFVPLLPPDATAGIESELDPLFIEVEVEIHTVPEPEPDTAEPVAAATGPERNRGGRGGRRGRGRGGIAGHKERAHGDRLVQVYPRDEDVPAEFMEMASVRGREAGRGRCVRGCGIAAAPRVREEPSDDISNANVYAEDDLREIAPILLENYPEAMKFDWQPVDAFCGQQEVFLPKITGPTQYFDNAYEAFRAIWTDDILDQIVAETNRYAQRHPNPRTPFKPTNVHEILMLFAFYMLLGIVKYPTIDSCFSKCYLYCNKSIRAFFTRDRYFELNSKLHFSDNLTADRTNRLFKISPVVEHLNQRFQALYIPRRNITIDESLTLWKGLLDFKQHMPKKSARFVIKSFELCCSTSSYLWSFFVYTGSQEPESDRASVGCPKVISTVLSLVRPLLHKGYTLWMDNWFNSPILTRFLKRNQTDCVGTLRKSRKHVPKHVVKVPLKKGQYMARASQDMCIMSWQDKRRVTTISTFHNDEIVMGPSKDRKNVYKPKVVRDYNKFMCGVDKKDQMLKPYHLEPRRCQKWYLKLFKHLLNVSILNSRILVAESTGRQVDHLKFCTKLVDEIFRRHFSQCAVKRKRQFHANSGPSETRYDLGSGHFPTVLSASDIDGSGTTDKSIDLTRHNKRKNWNNGTQPVAKKQCIRKRCVYCHEQNKLNNHKSDNKTTYKCTVCNVPLCCTPCFQLYHTRAAGRNNAPN